MLGTLLFLFMALLVAASALLAYRRRHRRGKPAGLTNEMVRRIEREGSLRYELPEPLDLDEIRDEEDAFWSQTWDEPEEW